jgi:hypothetical protein
MMGISITLSSMTGVELYHYELGAWQVRNATTGRLLLEGLLA